MHKLLVVSGRWPVKQEGFTYLGLLFAIALMGVTLALTGVVWHTVQQREKERDLLFVGEQFRQAIAAYYNHPAGALKQYPKALEELLKDPRQLATQRYLRRVYRDPVTGQAEWGLVKTRDDRIMGVYSLSDDEPFKQGNFREIEKDFEGKTRYSEWRFVYTPPQPSPQDQAAIPVPVPAKPNPPPPLQTQPGVPSTQAPDVQANTDEVAPSPADQVNPPESTDQHDKLCETLHKNDLGVCAVMTSRYGEEAGKLCTDSAEARYAQCQKKDGTGLPPLNIRFENTPTP